METLKGKHVVVTGGAGFAGSHLVDRLMKEEPAKITVLSNFSLGKMVNLNKAISKPPFCVFIERLDLTDKPRVSDFFCCADVDVVFHLASIPLMRSIEDPQRIITDITDMTLNLCEAQRRGHFKTLIQYSSSEVYGTNLFDGPMREDHPKHPTTPYAVGKLAADYIVDVYRRIYDIDVAIVRPFNFYGPRQNAGKFAAIIPLAVTKILRGEAVEVDGDGLQTRDLTYIEDVIEATVAIYKEPKTRGLAINIGSGKQLSIRYVVESIIREIGTGEIVYRKDRMGQVRNLLADCRLAESLIGYEPQWTFEDGLASTVEWYIVNGNNGKA